MFFIWIASSFSLSLLNFEMKYLKGDFFKNNFISGLLDVPLPLIGGLLYHKAGIRLALCLFFLVSFFGGIALIISSQTKLTLVPILILIAKGAVKLTFNICYLGNSFLFPTIFAATAFGLCIAGAKFFTIFSPMLAEVGTPFPMIILCIMTFSGAISSFFLKTAPDRMIN